MLSSTGIMAYNQLLYLELSSPILQEEVLFRVEGERQVNPIVGFWHGRVLVTRDRVNGTARVLRSDRTPFERANAVTERPALTSPTLVIPMRLDAFLNDVRQLIRDGAAP